MSKPKPRTAPSLIRIDSFSSVTHWGLKERGGGAAIMASFQLRLDGAGVSPQRLCSLDRITVLSNPMSDLGDYRGTRLYGASGFPLQCPVEVTF